MIEEPRTSCVRSFLGTVAPILFVPLGILIGLQISLVSDFGLAYTVDNIKLNPDMFSKQYARGIVLGGWVSIAIAIVIVLNAVFLWVKNNRLCRARSSLCDDTVSPGRHRPDN